MANERTRSSTRSTAQQGKTIPKVRSVSAPEHAIRERAYHIWEKAGRPHGRDVEFWERAKREIEN